jgi:uncharacterized protein YrrD
MTRQLVRATELVGLPVLSITEGESIAEIKDVLYAPERGGVLGFTMNRRRTLGGPLKEPLGLASIFAIGPDAVTVADSSALTGGTSKLRGNARADAHRNVLANQVLTDTGTTIGQIADLIVAIGVVAADAAEGRAGGGTYRDGQVWHAGDVVGYELAPTGKGEPPRFLPLPSTLSVSGEILMVPVGIEPYIRDELSALAPAVTAFRTSLREPPAAPPIGDDAGTAPPPPTGTDDATQTTRPWPPREDR